MSMLGLSAAPRQSPLQAWGGEAFRTLLATLAQPGQIKPIPTPNFLTEDVPVACRVPLALASRGTAIALVGFSWAMANEVVERTGARLADPGQAELIAFARAPRSGELLGLVRGTAARPESGASAAVEVAALQPLPEHHIPAQLLQLEIAGPGVADKVTVLVAPGTTDLDMVLRERQRACSNPPAGMDIWLIDERGHVLGLPRSSTITWKEYL